MASIDAFSEWAAHAKEPGRPIRASLRRLPRTASSTRRIERKERALTLAIVVIVHVALLFGLRAAMRMQAAPARDDSTRLIISFVESQAAPAPTRPVAAPSPTQHTPVTTRWRAPTPDRASVEPPVDRRPTPAPVAPTAASGSPPMQLYDITGKPRLPPPPSPFPTPRDLLARRPASPMLPGAPGPHSPDFHVQADVAPRDAVDRAGRILGGLIANADAVRSSVDGNGALVMAPDRGVRTSDRWSDPCQDIEQDTLNLDDAKIREQADEHYQASCEGH